MLDVISSRNLDWLRIPRAAAAAKIKRREGPLFAISDINLSCSGRPEDPLSLQSGLASVGDTGV